MFSNASEAQRSTTPEDDAAHDADVLHVIAAMSASHGEVQEVQACQEKPKQKVPL